MIQRYAPELVGSSGDYDASMGRDPIGGWVEYADHAAEVARLSKPSPAVARLVEEAKRHHQCATVRDDGTCSGCSLNDALAAVEKEIGT